MLELLKARFLENKNRHTELNWSDVEKRLLEHPASLEILRRMEESGGEPDTHDRRAVLQTAESR